MANNNEGNAPSSAVRENTPESQKKFQLKLLKVIDKHCTVQSPVQYSIKYQGDTITIQFLDEKKRVKTTAGGRGSRKRRKKRREMLQVYEEQTNDDNFAVIIRGGIDEPVLDHSYDAQGGHNPSPAQPSSQHSTQLSTRAHIERDTNAKVSQHSRGMCQISD